MRCPTVIKLAIDYNKEIAKYKKHITRAEGQEAVTVPAIREPVYNIPVYMMAKMMGIKDPKSKINIVIGKDVHELEMPGKIPFTLDKRLETARKDLNRSDKKVVKQIITLHEIDELKRMEEDPDFYKRLRLLGAVGAFAILNQAGLFAKLMIKKKPIGKAIEIGANALGLLGLGTAAVHTLIDKPEIKNPNISYSSHMDPYVLFSESERVRKLRNPHVTEFFKALRHATKESKHMEDIGITYGKTSIKDIGDRAIAQMIKNRSKSLFWKSKNIKLQKKREQLKNK